MIQRHNSEAEEATYAEPVSGQEEWPCWGLEAESLMFDMAKRGQKYQ